METIKNYLDNMFMNLPSTASVEHAKQELLQMMEDKYMELKEEGKTENETVGIVISEFGNLEELAETLGISNVLHQGTQQVEKGDGEFQVQMFAEKMVNLETAKEFLKLKSRSSKMIAIGVMLCIFSAIGPVITDVIAEINNMQAARGELFNAMGVTCMFVMVAAAVGLFVFSGIMLQDYEWLEKELFVIDFATKAYVEEARKNYKYQYAICIISGIILCVLSVTPTILLDNSKWEDLSVGVLLFMVGLGVFFIVMSSIMQSGYDALLKHSQKEAAIYNRSSEKSEEDTGNQKETAGKVKNAKSHALMSLYWPTIICLYLCWSFLTFDWNITWIIWPVAAIIDTLLEVLVEEA